MQILLKIVYTQHTLWEGFIIWLMYKISALSSRNRKSNSATSFALWSVCKTRIRGLHPVASCSKRAFMTSIFLSDCSLIWSNMFWNASKQPSLARRWSPVSPLLESSLNGLRSISGQSSGIYPKIPNYE